ncbi:SPOR domain-containing protein [Brevundimonas sp. LM2]|uniref:SPOR domain-containing protein n=1 Tax=Brevundimonas sp. LM2 TaxID=1938605 RepID=UPI0015C552ED|nr:SPOR domain-containing protein [Brevundimonas sp. LM2]
MASIPLGAEPAAHAERPRPVEVSAEAVENPGGLRVEVMDPHALWDARDVGLRGAIEQAPAMVAAAAPAVTNAMLRRVVDRPPVDPPLLDRPVPLPTRPPSAPEAAPRETLQLGAFASPAAARAAWTRISSAGGAVSVHRPAFETVEVEGRTLTRLKVTVPSDDARAVCRAADAAALGCLRRG